MDFGTRLRRMRIEAGLTQKELAEPTYTAAYVSTIEAGKRQPSRKALEHLSAKLSVDPDELLTGRSPDLPLQLEDRYTEARRALAGGDTDKAESIFTSLRREAKRFDLTLLEARGEYGRARCSESRCDFAEAIARYDSAAEIVQNESPLARVDAIAGKARCLRMTGEAQYATHLLEKTIAMLRWENLEDPGALLRLHTSLVAVYFHLGLYREANASAQKALEYATDVSDPERLANMHINVARVSLQQKHLEEAQRHYSKAEELFKALGFKLDVGRVHLARGFGLRELGEYDEARRHLETAITAFRETDNHLNEVRATNELARVERLTGRTAEAKLLLRSSLNLAQDGEVDVLAIAHREAALCEVSTDPVAAEAGLRKAIGLFDQAGNAHELALTYRELGDFLHGREERLQDACEAYRAAFNTLQAA
jgi:tetratricopeptide (TPR) repeat protein